MRTFLIISLLATNIICSFSQSTINNYEIIYGGNTIGSLVTSKTTKKHQTKIYLKSLTDTKVLFLSVHVESKVKIVKYKDILFTGYGYVHANRGSKDVLTKVTKMKANNYKIVKNGERKTINLSEIRFCETDLYFSEPLGITSVFSNTEGDFLPITPLANNAYKLTLKNGKSSTFYYKNSLLSYVEAEIMLGTLTFKRKV